MPFPPVYLLGVELTPLLPVAIALAMGTRYRNRIAIFQLQMATEMEIVVK